MKRILISTIIIAAAVLTACDKEESSEDNAFASCVTIANNHDHTLIVSQADVDAQQDKDYTTTGSADHTHTIKITSGKFKDIAEGKSVIFTTSKSGSDNHDHSVTILCN